MHGFFKRIVLIDLSRCTYQIRDTDPEVILNSLGGKGLGTHLLSQLNPRGVDPLSRDNHLIFATGPATGTLTWGSSRYGVFTKSPLTGLYAESYSGGRVPEAVSATGFDAVVLCGRAQGPMVVDIRPEEIFFHDGSRLWGLDTFSTEQKVKDKYVQKDSRNWKSGCAVIGPAGENQAAFSIIKNDGWRCAGRAGTGAVMGSKNLKALVFQGDWKRPVYDPKALKSIASDLALDARDNPVVHAYKTMGTSQMVDVMNKAGAFPTKYWQYGTCSHWEKINAAALHNQCRVTPHACARCYLSCGRMTRVLNGRHRDLVIEGPEYETIYAFGGLCMIDSIEEVIFLNHLCDFLGMDTITAGNLCAFAMEAWGRGKSGFEIRYGDTGKTAWLIAMIAQRKGVGDLLARGIITTAREWGMEDEAVHVKGMEPAGYDPRVLKGMGLGYATSDRGACHLRSTFYKPELAGMIPRDQIRGKAKLFVDFEDRLIIFDTLILCRFFRDIYGWSLLARLVHGLTGLDVGEKGLKKMASGIAHKVRQYNLQEGMKSCHEKLPLPLHRQLKDSGAVITQQDMDTMLHEYYQIRGWAPPDQGLGHATGK